MWWTYDLEHTSCVINPKDLTRSIFCFCNALLCTALCECLRLSVSSTMLFCTFLVLTKGSWPPVVWVHYACSIRGHQTWSQVGCFPYAAYFCCSHRLHQMKQQGKILVVFRKYSFHVYEWIWPPIYCFFRRFRLSLLQGVRIVIHDSKAFSW